MQSQDISLSYGIRRSPSIGNEGELSECVNLIPKNGELVNILPPKEIGITLPEGAILMYVHKTTSVVNYIYQLSDTTYYTDGEESGTLSGYYGDMTAIHSVGNTIIILTPRNMFYHILDQENGGYKYIGTKPPFPCVSFGLKGTYEFTGAIAMENPDRLEEDDDPYTFTAANKEYINNEVMGMVSKFIREETVEKNKFMFPFFIRYCYRLYDGTTTMLSSPILMIPSSGITPFAIFSVIDGYYRYFVAAITCSIDFKIDYMGSEAYNWTDIVKSLDIYVSSPIYTFDYNGEITGGEIVDINTYPDFGIFNLENNTGYKKYTFYEAWDQHLGGSLGGEMGTGRFILPKKEITDMNIQNSQFYKVASLTYEEACLYSSSLYRQDLKMDNYVLESLNNRESLDDSTNYQSLDSLIPSYGYSYNSRLNLANIKRELFNGYPLASMACFNADYGDTAMQSFKIRTFIREGDRDIVVESALSGFDGHAYYFFYPNSNAYKMEIINSSTNKCATVNLSPHPLLNGSYYFSSFDELSYDQTISSSVSEDKTVIAPNKIYTSEVNNPFYFPLAGINTVGTGEIMAIRSATKALSQGQFGQFPLYAFSTDGIWALQVSDEGLYSSVQPVSRDVCDNPAAITQIDSAVVFTTTAGLKVISGSEINLISSSMEGENTDETDYNIMPDFSSLFVPDTERFVETLSTCRISYDYANSMLRIYPEGSDKYYVYSLESGEYSTYVGEALTTVVEGYPSSIIQVGTKLYTFDKIVSDDKRKGVAITRPMAFGDPFVMKMLIDLKTIGQLSKGSYCKIGVFVSNDKNTWYRLGSLRKRPFKYYRFVYFAEMGDLDTLSGTRVIYDLRRANKLR